MSINKFFRFTNTLKIRLSLTTMKHKSLLFLVLLVFFASCKEDFSVWKEWNETWLEQTNKPYIDSLQNATVKDGYEKAGITETGIQYIVFHNGFGITAKRSSVIKVSYTNYLIDGTKVGSVTDAVMKVNELVAGWQEMICDRGLKQGANFKIYIPWNLAYGKDGNKVAGVSKYFIPPYSTLISEVIINEITNYPPSN